MRAAVLLIPLLTALSGGAAAGPEIVPADSTLTVELDRAPLVLIRVPSGVFVMGDGIDGSSRHRVRVTLTHDYFLGRDEITNAEYLELLQWAYDEGLVQAGEYEAIDWVGGGESVLLFMHDGWGEIAFADGRFGLREAPSDHARTAFPDGYDPADHPVKNVTIEGSKAFCNWLNMRAGLPPTYDHADWTLTAGSPYEAHGFRLPTEAEWERAARFEDGRIYPWGDEPATCERATYLRECVGWTSPVGSLPGAPGLPGGSFHDLVGNLWERVEDWWGEMPDGGELVDPVGAPPGTERVLKGCAWWTYTDNPRAAIRLRVPAWYRGGHVGFRIARTADPVVRDARSGPGVRRR